MTHAEKEVLANRIVCEMNNAEVLRHLTMEDLEVLLKLVRAVPQSTSEGNG